MWAFKYKYFLLLQFTGLVGSSVFQMINVVVNSDDKRSSLSLMQHRLLHQLKRLNIDHKEQKWLYLVSCQIILYMKINKGIRKLILLIRKDHTWDLDNLV